MNEKEKPTLEKAADKVNDVLEEIALKAADASIESDPQHVAGTSSCTYLQASGTGAAQHPSGRTRATVPQSPIKKSGKKEKAGK